ncbi:DNA internalization-related competence protein ComEC/Rec2 [Brevibacillus daliensis]|uniref:DNA internalization-related competence protein ComEC/Rec2 n=1 Tax=Brevibacillus daliensis TaxID=2892995 RepID=UPI001E2E9DA9|nr:DNA internalization-related competence protein ComEC/Rec2 [Brevibacillus daliensis]
MAWHRWFIICLLYMGGLILGDWIRLPFILLMFCVIVLTIFFMKKMSNKGNILAGAFVVLLGVVYFNWYDNQHDSLLYEIVEEPTTAIVTGMIDSGVKRDGDIVTFYARLNGWCIQNKCSASSERVSFRLKLDQENEIPIVEGYQIGQQFQGEVTIQRPDPARNPHAFDYARYLHWQAVHVVAESKCESIRIIGTTSDWRTFFENWQKNEAGLLQNLFQDKEIGGFFLSLILGLQDEVEPELQTVYSDLGLVHVIAISGLHITILTGCLLLVFEKVGLSKKSSYVIAACSVLLYVGLAGASASAVRSGLMGSIGLMARSREKSLEGLQLLGLSGLSMLLYNPYQLWHIGFQLSFGVTAGLLLLVPLCMQVVWIRPAWFRAALGVPVISQLVSFPVIIYTFHINSPLSWIVNFLFVPLYSFIVLPLGYTILFLGNIHPVLTTIPILLAEFMLTWLHILLSHVHTWLVPFTHWPHPTIWWLAVYSLVVIAIGMWWNKGYHRKKDIVLYSLLMLLLLVAARQPFSNVNQVKITVLDVGQGDSIVVEIGNHKTYLIDVGGTISFPKKEWQKRRDPFEVGKDIVLPSLRTLGIERIDHLILTHNDHDHVGGLPAILPYFRIGAVLLNGQKPAEEKEWNQALRDKKTDLLTGYATAEWNDGDEITWTWLSPDPTQHSESENNASIVLLLEAYGTRVLFTGDLEEQGEADLLKKYQLPKIDILKIGHHGSKTSTTAPFLQKLDPNVALISVGRNNRYKHPSQEVVDRIQKSGIQLFRTDRHGAITVTIDPTGYQIISQLIQN